MRQTPTGHVQLALEPLAAVTGIPARSAHLSIPAAARRREVARLAPRRGKSSYPHRPGVASPPFSSRRRSLRLGPAR